MPGVNSLEDSPYRPPMILGREADHCSTMAETTSRYSGSPDEPGSLVRSRTAIDLAVVGRADTKLEMSNGR